MYLLETMRELFTLNGMINAINIIPQILASFSIGSLKIAAMKFSFLRLLLTLPLRGARRDTTNAKPSNCITPKAAKTFHSLHWCQRHFSTLAFHAQPAVRGSTLREAPSLRPALAFPKAWRRKGNFPRVFLSAEWENVAAAVTSFSFRVKVGQGGSMWKSLSRLT